MKARSPIITEELKTLQSPLAHLPVAMPFRVPDGYFEAFSENLKTRLFVEESTDAAEPIPSFGKLEAQPFSLPENYFAQFAQSLSERIKEADFEETLSRENVFQVPQGYFETFADGVMAAVRDVEIVPQGLSREMPFAVPEGYFNTFTENLQSRLAATEAPKVVPLRPRKTLPMQVMRWAAAAALIIGVTTGIRQAGTPQATSETTHRALASVPEKAIEEYVSQNMDDFDAELLESQLPRQSFSNMSPAENLETREIQSFLSEETLL